jgi:hypothetical protein
VALPPRRIFFITSFDFERQQLNQGRLIRWNLNFEKWGLASIFHFEEWLMIARSLPGIF